MITVAIIGAGIGREHLKAYRALPDLFRVETICDLNLERARGIVGDGSVPVSNDMDAALADPDIAVIDICLPPHLHFEAASKALKAGKHVICEKPLVSSLAEADALLGIADAAPGQLYPVFQYRYGRAMRQLQALGDAGLLGQPYTAAIETHWSRGADYYAVPWRGTWQGENGGAVLGHAIHNHDLVTHLMGAPRRVTAMVDTRVNAIETEDCAAITIQTDRGALITSSITLGAAGDTTRLRLCYEHLTATSGDTPYAPMTGDWTFSARNRAKQPEVDAIISAVGDTADGFQGFLQAIANDVTGQAAAVVTARDGRQSLELVTAIYDAARRGIAVDLPLSATHPLYASWIPHTV